MGILVRHFLRSLLNADAVAPGSDPRMPWVVLTAIAAFPAVPLFFYLTLFNADPIPGLSFYLALAMNLSGLVAGIAWKSLLPSRTDFLVLAPLPLSSLRIAAAHLTALMILVAGFAGAMSIIPGVLLPAVSRTVTGHQLLARMGGEIAAAIAGAVWAFLAAMGLRAFAVAAFGEESWVCRMARFLLLTFLLAALGSSPALTAPENLRAIQQSDHWVMRPLQWFFALRACLSGSSDARTIALAAQAVEALFLSGVAALLLYGLATAQAARDARAGARGGGRARRRFIIEARNRLEHWYLRDPEERAVFRFGAATLMRSGVHWACVSAWVGAGVALAAVQVAWALWQDSGTAPVQAAFFAAPLWLGFFTLVGLRHSFAIPVDLPANWAFQQSETGPAAPRLWACWKLMVSFGVVPVVIATLPLTAWVLGPVAALQSAGITVASLLLLTEILLHSFRKSPFTCSYVAGKANVKYLWPLYGTALMAFSSNVGIWEYELRPHVGGAIAIALVIAAAAGWLARRRLRRMQALAGCMYEEPADTAARSLMMQME